MKITAFILLVACLQVGARGDAQNVTLTVNKAPLKKVFQQIQRQTGYSFLLDAKLLKETQPVSLSVKDMPIQMALDLCFAGQPLTYAIIENTIVIKEKPAVPEEEQALPPPVDVKGRVVNENGEPVLASVVVKGRTIGTTTNADGYFELKGVDDNAVLVITASNIETREISIKGRSDLSVVNVRMKVSPLDEMQVIAYGRTSKRLTTSNVNTVKSSDIEKAPVQNPLLAIQGRTAGVFIEQATGLPGSGVKVTIQGLNSINKGNDPLYIIDGVPYTSQLLPGLLPNLGGSGGSGINVAGNPLSFINPSDIESIDILKDADATSIYGSRAANGAILITTKKGKPGITKFTMNLQNGWGEVTKHIDLMNTDQYLKMRYEAIQKDGINLNVPPNNSDVNKLSRFPDLLIWDQNRYTDWQKILIGGTAKYTDVTGSLTGGNNGTSFLVSANYKRETTVFPGDLKDQKGSVFFNFNNASSNGKLRFNLTANYLHDQNKLSNTDFTELALTLPPNAPKLYNPDGSLNWEPYIRTSGQISSSWNNPLSTLNRTFELNTNNLTSNALISYQLLKNVTINTSLGYNNLQTDQVTTVPSGSVRPESRPVVQGSSDFAQGEIHSWIIEPQINYKVTIANGTLEALAGTTFSKMARSNQILHARGYTSDLALTDLRSATTVTVDGNPGYGTLSSIYKYTAVFGRLNYNFRNKYILNSGFRRDGSSRFGTENRFHDFGSVAGAWIFSQENWFVRNLKFFSFGKLKISYGTTGNDQIDDYSYLNLYEVVSGDVPYQGTNGLSPTGLPNPYLQWETTRKLSFSLDLGFLKDRLTASMTYYRNRSSNQLLTSRLPWVTGFPAIATNIPALVQNKGWEIQFQSKNIETHSFNWSSNFNITLPDNRLMSYPDLENSGNASSLVIGHPINVQRLFRFGGVDQATGNYQFYDNKGQLTSTPNTDEDRIVLFNPNPDFYGGFQNSFSFRSLHLDMLFTYTKQNGHNYYFGFLPGSNSRNQPLTVLSNWKNQGDQADIQRYNTGLANSATSYFFNATASDRAYSDASYIRLKNISLSWILPSNWVGKARLRDARLYAQAQNLLTLTHYDGLDPETRSTTSLPPLRLISVGIQIGL